MFRVGWREVGAALVAVLVVGFAGYVVLRPTSPSEGRPVTIRVQPSPTSKPPVSLAAARAVLASGRPVVVSVLGDSTGNDSYEWVSQWAAHLAQTRAVTVRRWDDASGRYGPASVLSTSGAPVDIWNASDPGKASLWPADKVGALQPVRPDLIVYNFGHNDSPVTVWAGLHATAKAVKARWGGRPVSVLMTQNPVAVPELVTRDDEVALVVRNAARDLGFGVLDARKAFAGKPLGQLLIDGEHPNDRAGALWAAAVVRALG